MSNLWLLTLFWNSNRTYSDIKVVKKGSQQSRAWRPRSFPGSLSCLIMQGPGLVALLSLGKHPSSVIKTQKGGEDCAFSWGRNLLVLISPHPVSHSSDSVNISFFSHLNHFQQQPSEHRAKPSQQKWHWNLNQHGADRLYSCSWFRSAGASPGPRYTIECNWEQVVRLSVHLCVWSTAVVCRNIPVGARWGTLDLLAGSLTYSDVWRKPLILWFLNSHGVAKTSVITSNVMETHYRLQRIRKQHTEKNTTNQKV